MSKVNKLTEEQKEEFKEAFTLYDKDKDNRINTKELFDVMKYLGQLMTPNQLSEMCGSKNHSTIKKKILS